MIFIYYCCNMQVLHKNTIWCWSQMQWKKEESWFILPFQHTICFWLQYYLKTEDNSASLDNMILIHKIFLITKRTRKKNLNHKSALLFQVWVFKWKYLHQIKSLFFPYKKQHIKKFARNLLFAFNISIKLTWNDLNTHIVLILISTK